MQTLLWREKVLGFLLDTPTTEIKVREVARKLGVSPAYVSRTLKILREEKLVKDNRVDLSSPVVRALKILWNMKKMADWRIVDTMGSLDITGAGVYGSWASGTNCEGSDLDIWIKVRKHPGEMRIASLVGEIRKKVGADVQMLVLTPEDVKRMKSEDPAFYFSLVFGSIPLFGEPIE
jgi:DNA-binding transcriptional ArsR family regulator